VINVLVSAEDKLALDGSETSSQRDARRKRVFTTAQSWVEDETQGVSRILGGKGNRVVCTSYFRLIPVSSLTLIFVPERNAPAFQPDTYTFPCDVGLLLRPEPDGRLIMTVSGQKSCFMMYQCFVVVCFVLLS
jgi:hypothetical protein